MLLSSRIWGLYLYNTTMILHEFNCQFSENVAHYTNTYMWYTFIILYNF